LATADLDRGLVNITRVSCVNVQVHELTLHKKCAI